MTNQTTAVLVIDAQKEYAPGGALAITGIEKPLAKISKILSSARANKHLIIHIRHISPDPGDTSFAAGLPGVEFIPDVQPQHNEVVLTKHYPGSFTNLRLDHLLLKKGIEQVIICGFSTFLCCDTTSREAYQKGYKVYFVEDAMASFDLPDICGSELHKTTCAIQKVIFSQVVSTDYLVKEILSTNSLSAVK